MRRKEVAAAACSLRHKTRQPRFDHAALRYDACSKLALVCSARSGHDDAGEVVDGGNGHLRSDTSLG